MENFRTLCPPQDEVREFLDGLLATQSPIPKSVLPSKILEFFFQKLLAQGMFLQDGNLMKGYDQEQIRELEKEVSAEIFKMYYNERGPCCPSPQWVAGDLFAQLKKRSVHVAIPRVWIAKDT